MSFHWFFVETEDDPKGTSGSSLADFNASAASGWPSRCNARSTSRKPGEPLPCILPFVRGTRHGYIPYRPKWYRELHPHSPGCSVDHAGVTHRHRGRRRRDRDQITLSVLYMFPVIIGSWVFGIWAGLMVSVAAATLIALVGFHSGHPFSQAGYFLINVASALFSFVLVTVLAARLRRALDRERALARTDFLTGIANRAAFYEVVGREIERQRRYQRPFGLAYIDCDNFKTINDRLGHQAGDELLRSIGAVLGAGLRHTDFVARLGGDEFAVLLPETGAQQAQIVMQTLHTALIGAMAERRWVVGFSVGLASFLRIPESADSALRVADNLMYQVKSDGKGKMLQQVYGDEHSVERQPTPAYTARKLEEERMKTKVNGIQINYAVEGAGPWVVFSHSLACDLSMWDEQVAALKGVFKVLRTKTPSTTFSSTMPSSIMLVTSTRLFCLRLVSLCP